MNPILIVGSFGTIPCVNRSTYATIFGQFTGLEMKQGIHPNTYPVVFVDGDHEWTGISTTKTNNTKVVNGVEHYVVNCEISAFSHPFYTGQKRLVDTAGRVEKFMRRYGNQMANQGKK